MTVRAIKYNEKARFLDIVVEKLKLLFLFDILLFLYGS